MIQQPQLCYPQQAAAKEAQYNAVKIDIHNPEVNAPGGAKPYNSGAPVYNYPQTSMYMPNMPTPIMPQAVKPQVPPKKAPVVEAEIKVAKADEAIKNAEKAVKDAEEAVKSTDFKIDSKDVKQKPAQPSAADKPVVTPKTDAPVPVAQAMNGVNPAELADKIKKAMNTPAQLEESIKQVASLAQKDKATAVQLQSPQLFEQLIAVTKQDTSKYAGPTPEQIDLRQKEKSNQTLTDDQKKLANKFSDLETAERNKQYALYTIAMLNKAILEQVHASGKVVKEDQIPAFNEIKDALKSNPNPAVREAAAAAIEYFACPECKAIIEPFMQQAAKDENPRVKERAEKVLKKLG